jgi:phosphoesterase RecJ-like protein
VKKNYRGGRIGEEIKRIISELLLRELKDPRFSSGMVSVTGVKAADDGTIATVYFTMLGSGVGGDVSAQEKEAILGAFASAKGLIRKEIGSRLGLRHTPDLRFQFDTSEDYGRHIESIIGTLKRTSSAEADASGDFPESDVLEDLVEVLRDAGIIYLFPHENMDGDTLGSSVALCLALRKLGKDCAVVIDEKIPNNIMFIENGCTAQMTELLTETPADISILVDVAEPERLSGRSAFFLQSAKTMCVDHHVSSKPIFDYNYIDTEASATSEIMYKLILALGVEIDASIAEAVYVGIVTDTGRFQYDNTSGKTHRIAADLLEKGVSPARVSDEIYHSRRIEKLYLEKVVLSTLRSVSGGKGVIAFLTQKMLVDTGALEEETEGIAEKLRSIRGVEVSAFVRETEDGRTKGSMRSRSFYDVAELAGIFGGGGHIRAAGFTTSKPLSEVIAELADVLEKTL